MSASEPGEARRDRRDRINPVPQATNRLLAWFLTGPIGRIVAFIADLGVALAQAALKKARNKLART